MTTSNLVVNLNRIRAANVVDRPAESAVFVFDYFSPESASGETRQRPLVRVISDSLRKLDDGDWVFKGINLYRINDHGKGISGAIRTFRLNRINGLVRQP